MGCCWPLEVEFLPCCITARGPLCNPPSQPPTVLSFPNHQLKVAERIRVEHSTNLPPLANRRERASALRLFDAWKKVTQKTSSKEMVVKNGDDYHGIIKHKVKYHQLNKSKGWQLWVKSCFLSRLETKTSEIYYPLFPSIAGVAPFIHIHMSWTILCHMRCVNTS